jgi:hypothetical protein
VSPVILEERVQATRLRGQAVCAALEGEIRKLGFNSEMAVPDFASARYSLQRDAASGLDSLVCDWLDTGGRRCGQLLFHADGSFWAEYDVVRPHPGNRRWFVEAVTAWGRDSEIKSEPRLLPALG